MEIFIVVFIIVVIIIAYFSFRKKQDDAVVPATTAVLPANVNASSLPVNTTTNHPTTATIPATNTTNAAVVTLPTGTNTSTLPANTIINSSSIVTLPPYVPNAQIEQKMAYVVPNYVEETYHATNTSNNIYAQNANNLVPDYYGKTYQVSKVNSSNEDNGAVGKVAYMSQSMARVVPIYG